MVVLAVCHENMQNKWADLRKRVMNNLRCYRGQSYFEIHYDQRLEVYLP